jgi:hypothetical protein
MGFFNTTKYAAKNITALFNAQIDNQMTFSFYIKDIVGDAAITQIEYSVLLQDGRDKTVLRDFTVFTEDANDIYHINETFLNTEVTIGNKLIFRFKIEDVNGNEHFIDMKDISVIN